MAQTHSANKSGKVPGMDDKSSTTGGNAAASKSINRPLAPLTSFHSTPHNVAWIGFVLGIIWWFGASRAINGVVSWIRFEVLNDEGVDWQGWSGGELWNSVKAFDSKGIKDWIEITVGQADFSWSRSIWHRAFLTPSHANRTPFLERVYQVWSSPQLGLYMASWAFFHLMEFTMTSMYNPRKLSIDSFVLNHGPAYTTANSIAILEFILEDLFLPESWRWTIKHTRWVMAIGLLLFIIGQTFRSLAMYTAESSFSHQVVSIRRPDHLLVTNGIYALCRHPSYGGFWAWTVGLQIFLGNLLCLTVFPIILAMFFGPRIKDEENLLIQFFGEDYIQYRDRIPSGVPFIFTRKLPPKHSSKSPSSSSALPTLPPQNVST